MVAYTSNNDMAVCIFKYVVLNGLLALQTQNKGRMETMCTPAWSSETNWSI